MGKAGRWVLGIAVGGATLWVLYSSFWGTLAITPTPSDDKSTEKILAPLKIASIAPCTKSLPIEARVDCFKEVFQKAVHEHGTPATLRALNIATTQDPDVLHHCHAITHVIGRTTYALTHDLSQAFAHCNAQCSSGCYHGTMEQLLTETSDLEAAIPTLCQQGTREDEDRYTSFQCLHGLGHGFMIHLQHELFASLEHCDLLPTESSQASCYGGVFMENIVAHDHHPSKYLQKADLHYPCTAVHERYKAACYFGITDWFVKQNGFDFQQAFAECERVPDTYRFHCFRSMGRSINWHTDHDLEAAIAQCAIGAPLRPPDGWPVSVPGICLMGAVLDLVNLDKSVDRAARLCAMAAQRDKRACYVQLGEALSAVIADPEKQAATCRRVAEERHVPLCRAAAHGRSSP